MSKREILGRHRATPVRTNPLEAISKAVSSNAGSVGRQAAVIAAASGLVLTLGVPQAAPAREAAAAPVLGLSPERVAVKAVTVSKTKVKALEIERLEVTSKPAPPPPPVVVEVAPPAASATASVTRTASTTRNAAAPVTRSNGGSTNSAFAPMTRESRAAGNTSNAPAPKLPASESSINTSSLSGIAATATRYVGSPYVWGGNTPAGWDCSGFVKYVYAKHGINIARGTSAIRASGQFVRTSSPKPGDLVFQNGGGHVGIYLGGGKMIGAQNPSVGTFIHNVSRNPLFGYYTLAK